MNNRFLSALGALGLTIAIAACATPPTPLGAVEIREAVIEQITDTQIQSPHHAGVGAVVGGVSGLGLGNLLGRGTGRDVARVLGAVGGALAGNEVQKNYDRPLQGQHIVVRMTSGVLVSVTQPLDSRLAPKQRVYLEGSGEGVRVVPRSAS